MSGCKGCDLLQREQWPKDMTVLRCMGEGLRGVRGRVLDVIENEYADNAEQRLQAPKWCEKETRRSGNT